MKPLDRPRGPPPLGVISEEPRRGPDSRFGSLPGVVRTRVGYSGGDKAFPTYHDLGDHADFDPARRTKAIEVLRLAHDRRTCCLGAAKIGGDRILFRRGKMSQDEIRTHTAKVWSTRQLSCCSCPRTWWSSSAWRPCEPFSSPMSPPRSPPEGAYADERKEMRDVAGPLAIKIGDRSMLTECIVGPVGGEPLVGQVDLEVLDLLADCAQQTLVPRPESPDVPLLSLK